MRKNNWSLLLLALPFLALLFPQLYSTRQPELVGIPFFIWYQFAWVIVGAVIVYVVYLLRRAPEETEL
jgi:hypothetical protein